MTSSRKPHTPTLVGPRGCSRVNLRGFAGLSACALLSVTFGGCGTSSRQASAETQRSVPRASPSALPGAGKPAVTIGDKNFTEQFVLGELYSQALGAQGFTVMLNRNIGPTEVTIQALSSGRLAMYPEYLGVWNTAVAGYRHKFRNVHAAYQAAEHYALRHGFELLDATPFSDTTALAVTRTYAAENDLHTINDLRANAPAITIGAAPQFQQSPTGLPALEQVYGFTPASFKPLDIGGQYKALDAGTVQAAAVNTT